MLGTQLFKLGATTFTLGHLILLVLAVGALFWVAGRLRAWITDGALLHTNADAGVRYAIGSIVRYCVIVLGLLVILAKLGIPMDVVTIVAGSLGVGIGFGLQQVTSNFVSGLILLVERPIKVGDRIEVGGVNGEVVKIAPRATTIVTNDNIAMIVPNSSFITSTVVNWSYSDRNVRFKVPVGVSYASDPERVREVLLRVARENTGILNEPASDVLFDGFGDSSMNFTLRVWTNEYTDRPNILRSDLYFAICRAFRESGIEIPFPQRDLHIRSGDEALLRG